MTTLTRVDRCTCVTMLCPCEKSPTVSLRTGAPFLDGGRCLNLTRRARTPDEPYLCPTCAWQAQADRSVAC